MEREKEIPKLVNVLDRIARNAHMVALGDTAPDTSTFCVEQYKKVLGRLVEVQPEIAPLFMPLPESTPPEVVSMSAKAVIAYLNAERSAQSETVDFTLSDMLQKASGHWD
jgi:hypothetical protein